MTFAWHHPSYYRKLKQNSRRPKIVPSMNDVSEVRFNPPTMETEVGEVGSRVSTHTSTKRKNN